MSDAAQLAKEYLIKFPAFDVARYRAMRADRSQRDVARAMRTRKELVASLDALLGIERGYGGRRRMYAGVPLAEEAQHAAHCDLFRRTLAAFGGRAA